MLLSHITEMFHFSDIMYSFEKTVYHQNIKKIPIDIFGRTYDITVLRPDALRLFLI